MAECIILADLVDLGLEPVPGVQLTVGVKYPTAINGQIISDQKITCVTNDAGRATAIVPQGVTVEAFFPPVQSKLVFSTDGLDSANLADIMRQTEYPKPDPLHTFPPSPHTHQAADLYGVVKTVNGEAPDANGNVVLAVDGGGNATIIYGPTAPESPTEGLLWLDSSAGGVITPNDVFTDEITGITYRAIVSNNEILLEEV